MCAKISWVVISTTGQTAVINLLHKRHFGVTCMKVLARSFVVWSGIDTNLKSIVKEFDHNQQVRHTPAKSSIAYPWGISNRPWEYLHADFA